MCCGANCGRKAICRRLSQSVPIPNPYQPIERDRKLLRELLQVLSEFDHSVAIITKGSLITRDIDILGPMAAKGLVRVGISITTLDPATSRVMEPRVPLPAVRLRAIRKLTDAVIDVRVMLSPVLPAVTDHELEVINKRPRRRGRRLRLLSCYAFRVRCRGCSATSWRRPFRIVPRGSWGGSGSCTAGWTVTQPLARG